MATAMRNRAWPVLAFLAMAAGIFLPAIPVFGEPGKPPLAILAPGDGAVMPAGRALVIGKASAEGIPRVEIDVNGKGKQAVPVSGRGFSAPIVLSAGRNVIRVSAGKMSATMTVSAVANLSASDKGAYVYHEGVEKCAECHGAAGKGYAVASPKDSVCYRCHDRLDRRKLLHGPMGSGECTACHDPHGSAQKSLTVARREALCVTCHDQQSSAGHLARAKGKACTACHDPHSSDKPFLQR